MTKELHKMVMTRSRLKNEFLKDKKVESKIAHQRQRNLVFLLLEKKRSNTFQT